jgi:hypothetical protein
MQSQHICVVQNSKGAPKCGEEQAWFLFEALSWISSVGVPQVSSSLGKRQAVLMGLSQDCLSPPSEMLLVIVRGRS